MAITKNALWCQCIIDNFLSQYRRPFDAVTARNMTGLSARQVRYAIARHVADGTIKEIEPGIYVSTTSRDISSGHITRAGQVWSFRRQIANSLMDMLEARTYRSIRALAQDTNYSHQYVYIYLEALVSAGCVAITLDGYQVINRSALPHLGANIDKGIIGRLRAQLGISPNRPLMRPPAAPLGVQAAHQQIDLPDQAPTRRSS